MFIKNISFAFAAIALSGCATIDNSTSFIPIAVSPDEHAEFGALRAMNKAGGLELTGWARSKRMVVSGVIHIEARSHGAVVAAVDVPWRGPISSRPRHRSSIFYIHAKLPPEALSADSIQVSHVKREHLHIAPEGGSK